MIERSLNISKYLEKSQSVFLFGARGTGKTSLVEVSVPSDALRWNLLEGPTFQRLLTDSSLFLKETRAYLKGREQQVNIVSIDEIQKLPRLLDEVHLLIEEFKSKVSFVLTGSSARKLKRGGANLLAGRALTKNLHPLSILETDLDTPTVLQIGSLPRVYLESEFAYERLESYVHTYLKEEIMEEALVRKVDQFARFLELAAQYNAEPINFSKLARSLRVSTNTMQEYFSILVDTLLCFRIDGWAHSTKKQLLQAPRFYWFDCGVLNAVAGELRSRPSPSSFRYGKLFETYLMQECVRFNDYQQLGFRFHYWRDKNGKEVDLILSRSLGKPVAAVEFKSSTQLTSDDFVGLLTFAEEYRDVPLYLFCNVPRTYQEGKINILPWQEGLSRMKNF